jgi:predicted amidohydrolase
MEFAAVQFKAVKGDWTASAEKLTSLIAEQATGAALIVCPEMALTGYVFADKESARAVAELSTEGPTFDLASEIARKQMAYVVLGYPEATPDGRLYNSAMILGPSGDLVFNYRKRLLYDADRTWALPGDTPYPLIDTPFGRMTCGICMDLNDGRFVDFLFDSGAELIAFPTNWLDQGFDVLEYWRWRLAGHPSWLIAGNTYGVEDGIAFRGRSAILHPSGQAVATAPPSGDKVIRASVLATAEAASAGW